MTYELQLFDDQINEYIPVETGDEPRALLDMAKGMARRVVSAMRGNQDYKPRFGKNYAKPLPLKPRVLHGMSGKPRKYKADTMIEPARPDVLAQRAIAWYQKRADNGETNIPVYVWIDEHTISRELRCLATGDAFRLVELNPDEHI